MSNSLPTEAQALKAEHEGNVYVANGLLLKGKQAYRRADAIRARKGESMQFDQHVRYKRTHTNAIPPRFMTLGAAGFDLACIEDIPVMGEHKPKLYSTGLIIATPPDHMLFITHRSSTPRKWGITVMNGIVDQDYCGDDDILSLQVMPIQHWSWGPMTYVIPAGTRIAQGIFIPVTRTDFTEVQVMGKSRGGYGSTG